MHLILNLNFDIQGTETLQFDILEKETGTKVITSKPSKPGKYTVMAQIGGEWIKQTFR